MAAMLYATTTAGFGAAGDPFKCDLLPGTHLFACLPATSAAKNLIINVQRAIDAMINKLPFFSTWTDEKGKPQTFEIDPIGTSAAGYDGKVGPETAATAQLALLGAIELRNQADGGMGQIPPELLSASKETAPKLKVQKVAFNASQILSFLTDATVNFDSYMAAIKERNQPVSPALLEPAPVDRGLGLKIPPDLLDQLKKDGAIKRGFPTLAVVSVAGLTLLGVGLYSMKKHRDEQSAGEMMGAGRRRRR
jgi:hypothetical protein